MIEGNRAENLLRFFFMNEMNKTEYKMKDGKGNKKGNKLIISL
jgi:hypothetical protein